jgi:hypothetical protein
VSTPVGDFTQIPVGPQPVQVCPPLGQGVTVTIYNADINNVVTVSRNNSVSLNASNGAPIQPLTSAVLDGSKALYAAAPAGTVPIVVIPQGGTLSPSPAQIAAQIAISGVSLLAKSSPLGSVGAATALAGGGTATLLSNVPVTQISYEFSISTRQSSAVATFPLIEVIMTWSDSATSQTTAIDHFYTSAFQSGGPFLVTVGTGPAKGDTLTVTMVNINATPITYTFSAAQNSRVYARDDWRWLGWLGLAGAGQFSAVTTPTYSETEQGILIAHTIAGQLAGTTVNVLIGLYCGNVWLHADETGVGPSNMTYEVITQTNFGTQPVYSSQVGGGPNGTSPNGPINQLISLPRSPCFISVTNGGAVASSTSTKIVIAEQAV